MQRVFWMIVLVGATLAPACHRSPMPKQIPSGEFTRVPFTLMDGSETCLAEYEG